MERNIYRRSIHKDENGNYGISFPIFPSCASTESSIEEPEESAKDS